MRKTSANVLLYVADIAAGAERSAIERILAAERGVLRAWMSPHARSLAIVDYDPGVTSAPAIRRSVEAQGLTARLVDM